MFESFYKTHLQKAATRNNEISSICPFHEDANPSFSANLETGQFFCHACGAKGNAFTFAKKMNISFSQVPGYNPKHANGWQTRERPRLIKAYDYKDETGKLLFQVCRFEPKDFRQRRPDGRGGWDWNLDGVLRVPYRLPEILKAKKEVIIVEGEKDADKLVETGFEATTNPGGAGKWRAEYCRYFQGKDCILVPDLDEPGRKHIAEVAASLAGIANSLRIIDLPQSLGKGADVSDFLLKFGADEFKKLLDSNSNGKYSATAKVVWLSEVQTEEVYWLWHPYIPLGKIVLLEGDPGVGKSWIALAITTAMSLGHGLPNNEPNKSGIALYLTAEDGLGDTIRPRLEKMGADLTKIISFDKAIVMDSAGLAFFEKCIQEYKPQLAVIDPLVAYIGAKVDIHRANETRQIMAALAEIANRWDCAILAIRHLNKTGQGKAIYRGLGSIDFTAACRSVLLAGSDPEDEKKCALIHIKSNLAAKGESLGYELSNGEFRWTGSSTLTADQVLATKGMGTSTLADAENFLREALAQGPRPAREIKKEARSSEISYATLRRGKESLGVRVTRQGKAGQRGAGEWFWELPIKVLKNDLDAQENMLSTLIKDEHLNPKNSEEAKNPNEQNGPNGSARVMAHGEYCDCEICVPDPDLSFDFRINT